MKYNFSTDNKWENVCEKVIYIKSIIFNLITAKTTILKSKYLPIFNLMFRKHLCFKIF